jgi:hypothetical protein
LFLSDGVNESISYRYFKYRLYVAYLMDRKRLRLQDIVDQSFDLNQLEEAIRTDLVQGNFKFRFSE